MISGRKTTTTSGAKLAQLGQQLAGVGAAAEVDEARLEAAGRRVQRADLEVACAGPTKATRTRRADRRPCDRAGCGTGRRRHGARTIARSCGSPSYCRTSSSRAASGSSSSTPASSTATTASTRRSSSRARRSDAHWAYRGPARRARPGPRRGARASASTSPSPPGGRPRSVALPARRRPLRLLPAAAGGQHLRARRARAPGRRADHLAAGALRHRGALDRRHGRAPAARQPRALRAQRDRQGRLPLAGPAAPAPAPTSPCGSSSRAAASCRHKGVDEALAAVAPDARAPRTSRWSRRIAATPRSTASTAGVIGPQPRADGRAAARAPRDAQAHAASRGCTGRRWRPSTWARRA